MTEVKKSRTSVSQIRRFLGPLYFWLIAFGFNAQVFLRSLWSCPGIVCDYVQFRRQLPGCKHSFELRFSRPCLNDKSADTGVNFGHYFHQDLLVAEKVFERHPVRHVDVGSRIDGFVAQISVFRQIDVLDIRPINARLRNINFVQCDLMAPLTETVECCDSLSCLHALEHFGLGRYGDTVNAEGYIIGLENLTQLLQPGGTFYLSVPIGPQRVEFNGERVFAVSTIIELIDRDYDLLEFSYVDDHGDLHRDVTMDEADSRNNFGCYYGCGIFDLRKKNLGA